MEQTLIEQTEQFQTEQIDVDREIEIKAMANMLRRSEGFLLAFAQCNYPVDRIKIVKELRQILGDYPIAEIEFDKSIENLYDELIPMLPEYSDSKAIFIYGLERSIGSEKHSPTVTNLNISRNLFPRHISCPLVIWLPAYAISAILKDAPDFFSWRSAIFSFSSQPETLTQLSDALPASYTAMSSLTLKEKEERIGIIESLLDDYRSLPDNRDNKRQQARLISQLGLIYDFIGQYDKTLKYYNDSMRIYQDLGDRSGIADSLYDIGRIHQKQGRYEDALKYYNDSLKISQEIGDRSGIASSLHGIGIIHQSQGRYEDALKCYNDSLKISQELDDRSGIAISLHGVGIIHQSQGRYEDALKCYNDSLKIRQEIGDRSGIARSFGQIGNIYYLQNRYEDASKYYNDSLKILQEIGDRSGIARALHNMGNIHYQQGRYEDALKYYNDSMKILQELGDQSGIAGSFGQIGLLYTNLNKNDIALRYILRAFNIFDSLGFPDAQKANRDLQAISQRMGKDKYEEMYQSEMQKIEKYGTFIIPEDTY